MEQNQERLSHMFYFYMGSYQVRVSPLTLLRLFVNKSWLFNPLVAKGQNTSELLLTLLRNYKDYGEHLEELLKLDFINPSYPVYKPIMYAMEHRLYDAARLLRSHGADISFHDYLPVRLAYFIGEEQLARDFYDSLDPDSRKELRKGHLKEMFSPPQPSRVDIAKKFIKRLLPF